MNDRATPSAPARQSRRRLCRTGIGPMRCPLLVLLLPWMLLDRRVGKATGSRECAPDDKLSVPTIFTKVVGTARGGFAHPTKFAMTIRLTPAPSHHARDNPYTLPRRRHRPS